MSLDLSANIVLFQLMAFLYCLKKGDNEIGLLSCALEMVYQASEFRVLLSFHEISDNTLPLFVEMNRYDGNFPPVMFDWASSVVLPASGSIVLAELITVSSLIRITK